MFGWQYNLRYDYNYTRKPKKSFKRRLAIFLLCILVLLTSLDPITTFSRYVVNLKETFALNTSNFYLTPSLELNELIFNWDEGFTPGNNLTVANYLDSNITTDSISYTITLEENRPTPIFDLYIDDEAEGKIICPNNTINGILSGGSSHINNHTLYFGLKDSSTPGGSYPVIITLTSSEPYIRSYNFSVNIQIESSLILIEGTEDIYRPNVEIPEGEIMVFKDCEYAYLTPEDLVQPVVIDEVVENMERPDLVGGSLYVPASIGELAVQANQTINWDVAGNIILEPDIAIYNNNITVNMLSHTGDVILNGITMTAGDSNPYIVDITAENGEINANGTEISSKADGDGKIYFTAKNDININGAELTSSGNYGVNIQSTEGSINAEGAAIVSTNGASGAAVILESAGPINLDQATVSAKVEVTISSAGDISARSANINNSQYGKNITITSSNGTIDLSSLETFDTVISSKGSVHITGQGDISVISARIGASTSWGMELRFESTGTNRKLWAEDANLTGKSITAYNLTVNGTPANGTITVSGP